MRIASGKASGISLETPRGNLTRPATDAARLAIFSSLGDLVSGADVLDLFAGTGAYGLEALSVGAKSACFVEKDRNAVSCLKKNISAVSKALGGACDACVVVSDCMAFRPQRTFDIVFADPPYDLLRDYKTSLKIFSIFTSVSSLNTDALFVLEAPAEFDIPPEVSKYFSVLKRLGKKSKGKPSQIIFKTAL